MYNFIYAGLFIVYFIEFIFLEPIIVIDINIVQIFLLNVCKGYG